MDKSNRTARNRPVEVKKWNGLETTIDTTNVPLGTLSVAENVVFDIDGGVRKREGFEISDKYNLKNNSDEIVAVGTYKLNEFISNKEHNGMNGWNNSGVSIVSGPIVHPTFSKHSIDNIDKVGKYSKAAYARSFHLPNNDFEKFNYISSTDPETLKIEYDDNDSVDINKYTKNLPNNSHIKKCIINYASSIKLSDNNNYVVIDELYLNNAVKFNVHNVGSEFIRAKKIVANKIKHFTEFINNYKLEYLEAKEAVDGFYFIHSYDLKTLIIPKAESIQDYAFKNSKLLTTLDLPSVKKIGTSAFENAVLTHLNIPLVTNVSSLAFASSILNKLELPLATIVNDAAFNVSPLTLLNLPLVKIIGISAFAHAKLTTLDLPEATFISERAFEDSQLTLLHIPKAKNIGDLAFKNIVNDLNTAVTMHESFRNMNKYNKDRIFGDDNWDKIQFTFVGGTHA